MMLHDSDKISLPQSPACAKPVSVTGTGCTVSGLSAAKREPPAGFDGLKLLGKGLVR